MQKRVWNILSDLVILVLTYCTAVQCLLKWYSMNDICSKTSHPQSCFGCLISGLPKCRLLNQSPRSLPSPVASKAKSQASNAPIPVWTVESIKSSNHLIQKLSNHLIQQLFRNWSNGTTSINHLWCRNRLSSPVHCGASYFSAHRSGNQLPVQ